MHQLRRWAAPLAVLALVIAVAPTRVAATTAGALTRYPYLTDVSATSAAVNWGTDRSSINGRLTWGPIGSSCTTSSATAARTGITVSGRSEYQWTASATGLAPDSRYCYRVYLGSASQTDLLGSDPAPVLATTPSADSYSFAVLGDWGQSFAGGSNPHQDAVLTQLANSGAAFTVFTGDTGYPTGTQTNYGDLTETGMSVSGVFAPNFWAKVGARMPAYATIGNHSPNSTFLTNWPETSLAAASGGMWAMQTYSSVNGTVSKSYPSGWYAFTVGTSRYYVLDAAWDDNNLGSGTAYADDYAAHWTSAAAEYRWLSADLAAHPAGLKFAFFHYPLYSDQSTEDSDTSLQGANSLEGLLSRNNVNIAFSGHAHVYERNYKMGPNSVVSYISGGGGAQLQSMGGFGCSPFNAFGMGWKPSTNAGSACGSAFTPSTIADVYHFLLVTVNGSQVTVRGIHENGTVFDQHTYDFAANGNGAPSAPSGVTAARTPPNGITVNWSAASDDIGVNAYEIARNGTVLARVPGSQTSYVDADPPAGTSLTYTVTSIDGNDLRSAPTAAPPLSGTTSTTLLPSADSYVRTDVPNGNYGTATALYAVAGAAARTSYLRFPLTALAGCSVTSAKLRLYVTDRATRSGTISTTDGTWTETGISASNAPPSATSPVVTIAATALNEWITADVTPLFPAAATELDLAISSPSSDRVAYSSREMPGQEPQLVVQCASS
jgi:hypothetical protein